MSALELLLLAVGYLCGAALGVRLGNWSYDRWSAQIDWLMEHLGF